MKAIKLPKELRPFLEFAEASAEETLVFTEKKRPVAALVSLRKVDRESLALSTNPEFLRIIETARKEIRAGKTTSLEELERKFRVAAPNKTLKQTSLSRRSLSSRRPSRSS
jgi:PHD/YefM family antitoxin component YafN of YafNO toxin-antitoxin module